MRLSGVVVVVLILSTAGAAACRSAPSGGASPATEARAGSGAAASAKPSSIQEIANYKGPDRQQLLEEGARKEGKMMLYTTGIITQATRPLLDAFMEKYPFIKTDVYRTDSDVLVRRAQEEYKVGKYEVDVWETATSTLYIPVRVGLLEKYWSPHLDKIDKDATDKTGFLVGVRESYQGLGFNTDLIRKEDVPRTSQDLLNPRWKGQMSIAGTSTGPHWIGALIAARGEEFVSRIAQQDIRVQNVSGRALADMVISAEVPLSPTIFDSHVITSREKGAPIEWVALEPVVTNLGAAALASKAPHPHAAMLYLDFLLSEEGQKIYMERGYGSPRTDIGGRANYKKFYPENTGDYQKEFDLWQRLMRSLFIRG